MIEKIKSWRIIYACKGKIKRHIVAIQVRDGLVYDYHGAILGFTKEQICGWNIYSMLRTMFNEYKIISMYRMKEGKYIKLDKKRVENIVREPISSVKKCFETSQFNYV